MSEKHCGFWIVIVTILLAICGCKQKEDEAASSPQVVGPAASEIAAVRDALTRGMQQIGFDKLARTQIGKRCVVAARTPAGGVRIPPPPPPLGMVRMMGQTTFYAGELDDISSDSLKIRAAYPTSGNYKSIEIPRADVESVHLSE